MTTLRIRRIALAWPLVALLAACVQPLARTSETAAARAVVRFGWTGSPDSLHPGLGVLTHSYVVYALVYDSLVQLELDGSFGPGLAESWQRSPDGLEWTFRLRPGSTFHDGVPVSSRDVVFSLELYRRRAEFPFLHGYTTQIAAVEAPDAETVVLRLRRPVPNFESQIVFLFVLPEHVWRSVADPVAFDNAAMVGSGPFRLVEHRRNEYVRLAAHRAHPVAAPRVDEVVFVTYGTLDALAQALRSGEVDVVRGVSPTAVRALRRAPEVEVTSGVPLSPSTTFVEINQVDPLRCPQGGACNGHPALRDLAVRQALAHAAPKRELLDVLLLGEGAPGRTLIPEGLVGFFHADLVDHAFDLDRARRLLDRSGYRDRDGDGVRESPDGGRSLAFRFDFASDDPAAPRAAELLARSWARIGVRLERRAVDPNALAAVRGPSFDYDLLYWSWTSDPDPNFMLQAMTSEQIALGGNYTGWSDPEYDELYLRQAATLDADLRRRLVWRMQEIALREVVYIVPFYERAVAAYRRDRFRGWRTDGTGLALEDRSSLARVEAVAAR
jgi:peptide/nickel transport system substrate-binding protein